MDELIAQLTAKVGIDKDVAEKSVGMILEFLRSEGPTDQVNALIAKIPGADAAITSSQGSGGLMGSLGGMMGGGLMALGSKLMGLGLGMGEIKSVSRELFKFGREKIGAEEMDQIIAGTPGLSQFV